MTYVDSVGSTGATLPFHGASSHPTRQPAPEVAKETHGTALPRFANLPDQNSSSNPPQEWTVVKMTIARKGSEELILFQEVDHSASLALNKENTPSEERRLQEQRKQEEQRIISDCIARGIDPWHGHYTSGC